MSNLVAALAGGICAIAAAVCLLIAIRVRRGTEEGRQGLRSKEARQMARAEGVRMLGALLKPQSEEELDQLKQRLVRAGYYGSDHPDMFLTVRLVLLIGGLLLALIVFGLLSSDLAIALGAAAGIVGLFNAAPNHYLRTREKERQGLMATALPPALDLLVVCLEAGLGLEQALERVASGDRARSRDEALLVSELDIVLADMRVGMSVGKAFRRFAERIGGEEANNVVSAITRAASTGAKLAGMLRAHADGTRRRRLVELEEASGKANARLALPLTLLLMPSALIVVAGPSFLSLLQSF
jgi:tight adherence protein C